MKNIKYLSIIILAALMTSSSLSAQTVYKSSGKKNNNRKANGWQFDKEKVVVGGNFGFYGQNIDATTTYSFFEITPMVGYEIADFDNMGISFGYQYSRYKFREYYNPITFQEYTYKLSLPTYYFGAWNQLFVIPQLFISTEFLFTTYKYTDGSLDYDTGEYQRFSGSSPSLLLGAGYANRRSKDQNFYYAFWLNYDVIQNPNSPYYSGNDLIAGLFYKTGFFFKL